MAACGCMICMVIVVGSCFEVSGIRETMYILDEEAPRVCGDEPRGGRTIPQDA